MKDRTKTEHKITGKEEQGGERRCPHHFGGVVRLSRLHRLTEKKKTNQTKDFVTVKQKKLKLDAHTHKKKKRTKCN